MNKLLFVSFLLIITNGLSGQQFEVTNRMVGQWYKGNIHTHTNKSDGDTSPEEVAMWYKNHGYNFLAITDYHFITMPSNYNSIIDATFILITGEEITIYIRTDDVDINALGIDRSVAIQTEKMLLASVQKGIDIIRKAGGVPIINHPNRKWRIDESTIYNTSNCHLFELYNGGSISNNAGDEEHSSTEQMWDDLLSRGKRIYGVATDDAHHWFWIDEDTSGPGNPGRAWIYVCADKLTQSEILYNLEKGNFYSSTGVKLKNIEIMSNQIRILIDAEKNIDYLTEFIGIGGKVIYHTTENPAKFTLFNDTGYIRAKITDTNGHSAWIQPVFIKDE